MGGPLCSTNPDNLLSCLWWDFLTNLYGEVETKNLPSVTFNKKRMCNPRPKLRFSNLPSLHREGGGFQVIFIFKIHAYFQMINYLIEYQRICRSFKETPMKLLTPQNSWNFCPSFFTGTTWVTSCRQRDLRALNSRGLSGVLHDSFSISPIGSFNTYKHTSQKFHSQMYTDAILYTWHYLTNVVDTIHQRSTLPKNQN